MTDYPLWSLALLFAALAGTFALLVVARRQGWAEPPIAESQPKVQAGGDGGQPKADLKSRLGGFLREHRWGLLLAAVGLAVILYLIVFAPAQLTGRISITPREPGRPFFFLHWQRNTLDVFFYEAAQLYNLGTGLLAMAMLLAAWRGRSLQRLRTALLWGLLGLAGAAQWCLAREPDFWWGVGLYLAAAAGLAFWAWTTRRQSQADVAQPIRLSRGAEIALVLLIMALAVFGRLFELRTIPYGIEGDEAKWTGEVVWLGIRGLPDLSGLYHRDALPTSFYMQTPFHEIFGPSIFSARLAVAVFSILGCLLFYLLVKRIANLPLALLAAWLLSGSIFDISASRLANVESHVKLWPILTLLLLAWAIPTKRWQAYAVSGVALAVGLLTYDTVWPLLGLALLLTILEISRQEEDFGEKVKQITALLAPSLAAVPILMPYFASRVVYYEFGAKGWGHGASTLWSHFTDVVSSWFLAINTDFLYNRHGPLLNAFLLPWLVLGLIVTLVTLRQRFSAWTLAWFALFMLPVPIAAHSPLGRLYYPGLPAAYALAALGLYLFARDGLRALGKAFHPLFLTLCLVVVLWLPLMNLYIYFNEVSDPHDRQVRREVGEMAAAAAGPDTLVVLPSVPRGDEPLNNEYQMIELFMLQKLPSSAIPGAYTHVALEALLPALPDGLTDRPNLEIILDKETNSERAQRDALTAALQRCYPKGTLLQGYFFDRFSLPASALADPACIAADLTLQVQSERGLSWSLSQGSATGLSLRCEVQNADHQWIEAEGLPLSPGWQTETAFATDWSGGGFLLDNYNSQPIQYSFDSPSDGSIYLWLRTLKRTSDATSVRLTLNDKTDTVAAPGTTLQQWNWQRVGPFPVHTGSNILILERPYTGDPMSFMAIFIDVLVITPDSAFDPTQDQYQPLPIQSLRFDKPQSNGLIPLSLDPGSYRCTLQADSDQNLVDAFGHAPLQSNPILFDIQP